ncbi:hypothetical protein WA026_020236 [Henosepilachna vigintioctopunctata]|uniref:Mitotic checkpoint serine/threonine-protein kinase BUB1 n=1 Tax=Henosepilachna vigintioctopunctata TaxID=420089 RepID=A0AAW1TXQ9_9CUCU
MDFDLSKENIQPLRGGRNVLQLGLALQAESSQDIKRELQHQREIFENSIRTYQGEDPLENWYQFISWVEQSYPKNGHEGNLIQLLEHCLKLFENDKRYTHDRRFCKLWIRYIDLQQNPLELYQMMNAKGLLTGCADLYKAWAYYHEAEGDYKSANTVFELGKQNLAQPFDELDAAHQNLVMAAGTHMLYGPDERRLHEKRQALTSLRTYKSGRVGSVRVAAAPAGIYPTTSTENIRPNAFTVVYQDQGDEVRGAAAPPVSILTAVKRQEAPKENTMKPGPWMSMPVKKKMAVHHTPSFTVHIDDDVPENNLQNCIDLNKELPNFPIRTKETYVEWVVSMTIPEPVDNRMLPMYPKARVYADPTTEYSLEELAALRYHKSRVNNSIQQTCQLQTTSNNSIPSVVLSSSLSSHNSRDINVSHQRLQMSHSNSRSFITPMQTSDVVEMVDQNVYVMDVPRPCASNSMNLQEVNISAGKMQVSQRPFLKPATPIGNFDPITPMTSRLGSEMDNSKQMMHAVVEVPQHNVDTGECNFQIWTSPSPKKLDTPKQSAIKFYEHSQLREEVQAKGSAMKTPFKILNADDLAETGSRGSTDTANAAQPMDSANIKQIFDDSSNSSFEEITANIPYSDLNASCNTQVFNFNINALKVSTPQPKQNISQNCFEQVKNTKKQLFEDTSVKKADGLSIILEESNSRSCSSSSGATTKSSVFGSSKPIAMSTISEEHNNYLVQNLMANEALRKSLLGDLLPSQEPSPVTRMQDSPIPSQSPSKNESIRRNLDAAPSDPFRHSEIEKLLRLVSFPGPHVPDFHSVPMIPRLSGKKETLFFGQDQFLVEKVLGKGTFGTVYKALDLKQGKNVALKYQKPANKWEFYICREIQTRLRSNPLRERFMDVSSGYFSEQASILVYAFMPHGSLLDLANQVKIKTGKTMQECLCFYFCIQMLRIVEAMHQVKIIHADIKPDNFLIQLTPDNSIELQLIDFGCSIDMSLYPPNTAFTRKVTTESFICCEMQENKPWNYHTDLFCIAATTHVLLFDKYIELQKKYDAWSIKEKFPRYMKSDLWNKFFNTLLNQQSEASHLQVSLDEALSSQFDKFTSGMKTLVNLIKNR